MFQTIATNNISFIRLALVQDFGRIDQFFFGRMECEKLVSISLEHAVFCERLNQTGPFIKVFFYYVNNIFGGKKAKFTLRENPRGTVDTVEELSR